MTIHNNEQNLDGIIPEWCLTSMQRKWADMFLQIHWNIYVAGVLLAKKRRSTYRLRVSLLLHNGYQYPYPYPCTGTNDISRTGVQP